MPDASLLLKYVHILAAFVYVTGYLTGGILAAAAGRTTEWPARDALMRTSETFTNRLLIPGFIAAAVLGVITALVMGYPLTSGWVLYALVVFVVMLLIGILFWGRLGRKQMAALQSRDDATFVALGRQTSVRVVTIVDGLLLLLLIYLMVARPA